MTGATRRTSPYVHELDELNLARERALRAGDAVTATLLAIALRSAMNRRRSAQIAKRRLARSSA